VSRAPVVPKKGFYIYDAPQGWSQYYLDGEKLLSVSKVKEAVGTGDGLQRWAASMERESLVKAAEVVYGKLRDELLVGAKLGATLNALPAAEAFVAVLRGLLPREMAYETYRDEQADIGREVHSLLEGWFAACLAGGPKAFEPPAGVTAPALTAFTAALTFLLREDVIPLASERPVYSPAIRVGGRLDKIALVRGRPAVIDWKSTKTIRYTDKFTTAAYRMLYNDCPEKLAGVPQIDVALVVKLPKVEGAQVELHAIGEDECDDLNRTFCHAAQLRRALDANDVFDWRRRS
jgi:hypothetical protein